MKAYSTDLRERVVHFVQTGGTRAQAAQRFQIGERTVYRYLAMQYQGSLEPKKSWGSWKKLDPQKLKNYIHAHADATLREMHQVFGVSPNTIWVRLNQLGITLKKTHKISGKR
jgi:transposase